MLIKEMMNCAVERKTSPRFMSIRSKTGRETRVLATAYPPGTQKEEEDIKQDFSRIKETLKRRKGYQMAEKVNQGGDPYKWENMGDRLRFENYGVF